MKPTAVKVVGQTMAIQWLHSGDSLSKPDQAGRCEVGRQLITIDEGLGDDQQKDTVLHELTHAALRIMGAGLSDATEEKVVGTLAPLFLDILRSNPALVKWLTE